MSFVKPNDDDPSQTPENRRRDEADVGWSDTPVSLREAVETQDGLLTAYVERAVTKDDLDQLTREYEAIRKRVDNLERIVDVLAAVSPASIVGDCPECDGELALVPRTSDESMVTCERCGRVVAQVENRV
jgi:hypothetical protein